MRSTPNLERIELDIHRAKTPAEKHDLLRQFMAEKGAIRTMDRLIRSVVVKQGQNAAFLEDQAA